MTCLCGEVTGSTLTCRTRLWMVGCGPMLLKQGNMVSFLKHMQGNKLSKDKYKKFYVRLKILIFKFILIHVVLGKFEPKNYRLSRIFKLKSCFIEFAIPNLSQTYFCIIPEIFEINLNLIKFINYFRPPAMTNLWRTSDEHLMNIWWSSDEHLMNIWWTSIAE